MSAAELGVHRIESTRGDAVGRLDHELRVRRHGVDLRPVGLCALQEQQSEQPRHCRAAQTNEQRGLSTGQREHDQGGDDGDQDSGEDRPIAGPQFTASGWDSERGTRLDRLCMMSATRSTTTAVIGL
jgi:hypothetical protein